MKIIGFDQSTKLTGYAIYEDGVLTKHAAIRAAFPDTYERMKRMYNEVQKILKAERPDFVMIEGVQFQSNYKVYSTLSQLQGLFFAALFDAKIPFEVAEASTWRHAHGIKGKDRASQKKAAMDMVRELGINETIEDVCEAILIAKYAVQKLRGKNEI